MAIYYQGRSSEIQTDGGLHTLYLMNPNYLPYSEAHHPSNTLLLSSAAANALNSTVITHVPLSQAQHFTGLPFHGGAADAAGSVLPRHTSNYLWGSIDHHHQDRGGDGVNTYLAARLGFHKPSPPPPAAVSSSFQSLSLSLSPQEAVFRSRPLDHDSIDVHNRMAAGLVYPRGGGNGGIGGGGTMTPSTAELNAISGMQSDLILGSKYLKATQELLDEVVHVEKDMDGTDVTGGKKEKEALTPKELSTIAGEASKGGEGSSKAAGAELTTAQRHELQVKKAKLMGMLDEVDERYKQYHNQIQIVVASFEQATGTGSAKSYTKLAFHTISKQFRCLKDAIKGQIKATSKSLGEENEGLTCKFEGSVRSLKFVDHQLRQQRALQTMQSNAWRPQRGLPERAVSVLRAWLFDNFLHPYPKDSDKIKLAKQTGLTRGQVSNWFINARVRLWKPMVEEMYTEEMKNQVENGADDENSRKTQSNKENIYSKSSVALENSLGKEDQINQRKPLAHAETSTSKRPSSTGQSLQHQQGFRFVGHSSDMETNGERAFKKPRNEVRSSPNSILSMDMEMKDGESSKGFINQLVFGTKAQTRETYMLMDQDTGRGIGFGTFSIGELGRMNPEQFTSGFHANGVSLTLGLPPSDQNLTLPLSSGSQQNYLSDHQSIKLGSRLGLETVGGLYNNRSPVNNSQAPHESNLGYDNLGFQNGKPFAAQLLPDFME